MAQKTKSWTKSASNKVLKSIIETGGSGSNNDYGYAANTTQEAKKEVNRRNKKRNKLNEKETSRL